jgi:hypothetical protein
MTSNASWYESGFTGADKEQEKRELGGGPKHWWMPAATTRQGVLVDDNPFCCQEHQWKTGDSKFPSFGTCISNIVQEQCPACASRAVQKAEYTGHLTIIDITGYKTKDKEVRYELIEFCPKIKVLNKLKLKKTQRGSLVGLLLDISRTDKDAPNTGDDIDVVREAKMTELYKVVSYRGKNLAELIAKANTHGDEAVRVRKFLAHNFQIPTEGEIPEVIPAFNYQKLHQPMEVADFKRAIANAVSYAGGGFGSGGSGGGTPSPGSADETVPF